VTIGIASAILLIAQAVLLAQVIARVFLEGKSLAAEWPVLAWLGRSPSPVGCSHGLRRPPPTGPRPGPSYARMWEH